MTIMKIIEPAEWKNFLNAFSERNSGRRARFEYFGQKGDLTEEDLEGTFKDISIDGHTAIVNRHITRLSKETDITRHIENIRGITVQYDSDGSEDMLEFTDQIGNLTALHFESMVDGAS